MTSASDGLVKLWNIKEEECVKTLDNHEDKIWALAHSSDESTLLSAGADSLLTIWHDTSLLEQSEANAQLIKTVQVEQDFINYVALKDYRRAILLALSMSQPGRLFNLFSTVVKGRRRQPDLSEEEQESQGITGSKEIDEIVKTLPGIELVRLLKFVRDWNANAKMAPVAQVVLHAVFKLRSAEDILAAFDQANRLPKRSEEGEEDDEGEEEEEEKEEEGKNKKRQKKERPSLGAPISIKDLLEGLIPYSERHFNRVDKLVQESYMLDYVLGEMEGGLFGEELMDIQ